jgi:chemotaxis response regulator CheB
MPKAAAAIDAAVEIRPLERIAGRLTELFEMTTYWHAAWPAVTR